MHRKMYLARLLLLIRLHQACINYISENVLYKIRNLDFLNNQFYALHNLMKVYGDSGQTNASTFLWSLAKHPTRPNTYMIHNFDRSDHVLEGYLEIADWNAGLSNCSNDHQWFRVYDLLGDKNSTINVTKCLISMNDEHTGHCFLLQGKFWPFLYNVDCFVLASNDTQKSPSNLNIFEFIRMSSMLITFDLKL